MTNGERIVKFKQRKCRNHIEIPKDSIIYIEIFRKAKTDYVFTLDGTYEVMAYSKYELLGMLDDPKFVICSNSFIVNLDYATSIVPKNSLALSTGEFVKIGGKKYRTFLPSHPTQVMSGFFHC